MKSYKINSAVSLIIIILILASGYYYYRIDINKIFENLFIKLEPCEIPLTYSINNIDPRFNLNKDELINELNQAEKIWESPINKNLFEYSSTGDLKINLAYDYRQQATDELKKIGIVIDDNKSAYETLKTKYETLSYSYKTEKTELDSISAKYNADKDTYEQDVITWNKKPGTKIEYNTLEQKRIYLDNQALIINQKKLLINWLKIHKNQIKLPEHFGGNLNEAIRNFKILN